MAELQEWLHGLGWLFFLITVWLWFVRARLAPPAIGASGRSSLRARVAALEAEVARLRQDRDHGRWRREEE